MSPANSPDRLSFPGARFFLVVLPVLWLPLQFVLAALPPTAGAYDAVFVGEGGVVEIATALFLLPAAGFAVAAARRLFGAKKAAAILLCVFAFGCLFLMGEELSWGQHAIGWGTPDYFAENNLQDETNLHNLAGVNKSVPKWVLVIGMAAASIALPWWSARRGLPSALRTGPLAPLVAGGAGAVIAGVTLVAHLAEKAVARPIGLRFEDRFGVDVAENVEVLIAAWLAVYAYAVWRGTRAP